MVICSIHCGKVYGLLSPVGSEGPSLQVRISRFNFVVCIALRYLQSLRLPAEEVSDILLRWVVCCTPDTAMLAYLAGVN